MQDVNIFVYGSLMKGGSNHQLMDSSEYLGEDALDNAELVDLVTHPILIPGKDTVYGESYRVSLDTLEVLDRLEGHPNYYQRRWVYLKSGCHAMVYEGDEAKTKGYPRISNGRWRSASNIKQDHKNQQGTFAASSTYEFLSYLRSLDIEIFADGEKLRCNAPKGALTPTLQAEIVERKVEILAFLRKVNTAVTSKFSLFPLRLGGSKLPLFWIHGAADNEVLKHLCIDQPIYSLRYGIGAQLGNTILLPPIEQLATHYIEEMHTVQPKGPYFLIGHSWGGLVAYEMAHQLSSRKEMVAPFSLWWIPIYQYLSKTRYHFRFRLLT